MSKVILFSKTPPSLRATSSINRGGAGDSSRRQGVFSALPLFIEGVPRRGEGVLKNDLSDSPVHHLLSFKDLFNFINND